MESLILNFTKYHNFKLTTRSCINIRVKQRRSSDLWDFRCRDLEIIWIYSYYIFRIFSGNLRETERIFEKKSFKHLKEILETIPKNFLYFSSNIVKSSGKFGSNFRDILEKIRNDLRKTVSREIMEIFWNNFWDIA